MGSSPSPHRIAHLPVVPCFRVVVWALLPLLAGCGTADSPVTDDVAARLDAIIEQATGESTLVSSLVVSLEDGRIVHSRMPGLLARPASTMKLLTTAAVCIMKPDLRVVTRLELLPGECVVLRGGGDPLLTPEDLENLVNDLERGGFNGAVRTILYDDPLRGQARFGEGWMWDDEPAAFMPHIAGLTVSRGCVEVVAEVVDDGTIVASATPPSDHISLEIRPAEGPLSIDRDWMHGGRTVFVLGKGRPGGRARRSLSVPDPPAFAASVLAHILRKRGRLAEDASVRATTRDDDAPPLLSAEVTRPLPELLAAANQPSDNLVAELLLRHLGTPSDAAPGVLLGPAAGIAVVTSLLEDLGFARGTVRIADGSGVSHYDLITAELLVRLLVHVQERGDGAGDLLLDSLAVAGRSGTLANRMQGHGLEGRVRGKTGTISAVSALAGYMETLGGEPLAFAFLVQNFVGSPRPWRAMQDRLCEVLFHMTPPPTEGNPARADDDRPARTGGSAPTPGDRLLATTEN